jgi:transcriptional regulator with XRE-family HTH domain
MVKKVEGLEQYGFDVEAYRRRLQLLRQIVSGENQQDFAARIGVDKKRWNNYEQGYPVPREVAMLLMARIEGFSIEWLWFGKEKNLSDHLLRMIKAHEALAREQSAHSIKIVPLPEKKKPAAKKATGGKKAPAARPKSVRASSALGDSH